MSLIILKKFLQTPTLIFSLVGVGICGLEREACATLDIGVPNEWIGSGTGVVTVSAEFGEHAFYADLSSAPFKLDGYTLHLDPTTSKFWTSPDIFMTAESKYQAQEAKNKRLRLTFTVGEGDKKRRQTWSVDMANPVSPDTESTPIMNLLNKTMLYPAPDKEGKLELIYTYPHAG
jgi:hypothetical protein